MVMAAELNRLAHLWHLGKGISCTLCSTKHCIACAREGYTLLLNVRSAIMQRKDKHFFEKLEESEPRAPPQQDSCLILRLLWDRSCSRIAGLLSRGIYPNVGTIQSKSNGNVIPGLLWR